MRRLTAYVVGSTAAATLITTHALLTRPNFYSATVHLSHSNLSLLILSNFFLVLASLTMYTLQHLLFGPLRPLETEQLWERGWFAMMEWVFAMSTFRDEFGVWFLVMFGALFAGKVWGWIAEGRVEVLEQQQTNNRTLVHKRLLASLAVYVGFAVWMELYCIDVVVLEARPGMTIMFVFEFAILVISAVTACARYALWAYEHSVTQSQIAQAVSQRKLEIRKQRAEAEAKIKENPSAPAEDLPNLEDLPKEDDVDENEIEAPGWEAKRGWLFALDITSDLFKLVAYMAFFTILTVFYGIPIYIIRDLYMTMRSFTKRVSDYLRFQAATRDMDTRYPNATAQDLAADNTCIVCREEMRPVEGDGAPGVVGQAMHQRQKPKKLPCGHILHFGCLSSWLERQQACPICRRSVFAPGTAPAGAAGAQAGAAGVPGAPGAVNPLNPNAPRGAAALGQQPQNRGGGRVFNLGPLQIQFGGRLPGAAAVPRNDQELLNALGRLARQNIARNQQIATGQIPPPAGAGVAANGAATNADLATQSVTDPANSDIHPGIRSAAARMALNTIEAQIEAELRALRVEGRRANAIRNALNELDRARNVPQAPSTSQTAQNTMRQTLTQQRAAVTPGALVPPNFGTGAITPSFFGSSSGGLQMGQQVLPFAQAPPSSSSSTTQPPPGVVVPQGWTLTPLNPITSSSTESSPQQQYDPQILQQMLQSAQASASASASTRNQNHPSWQTLTMGAPGYSSSRMNNPLSQFYAMAQANERGHGHGHSHGNTLLGRTASQGPFPPPPHPHSHPHPSVSRATTATSETNVPTGADESANTNAKESAESSTSTVANGSTSTPPASGSNEITPTATNSSALPTPSPLPPAAESTNGGINPAGEVDAGVPPPPASVVPQSWAFPPTAPAATPTSAPEPAVEGTVIGKGKAPAVDVEAPRSVPETHVEPPTPITSHESEDGRNGVERDGEGQPVHPLEEIRHIDSNVDRRAMVESAEDEEGAV